MGEETDDMVESTSKLRALVKGMTGFDIMKDENTFKSMKEIIVGIGQEFEKLNDIDQAALLESLAGKNQSNRLAAALQNWRKIEEVYKTAEESEGSAQRENERRMDSIEAKFNQVKASAQEWANDFMDSGFIKFVADLTNGFVKLTDAIGPLNSLLAAGGLVAGFKNVGRVKMLTLNRLKYADSNSVLWDTKVFYCRI